MQNIKKIRSLSEFQFNNLFNSTILSSLPYMFWMYEYIDYGYKLIQWNKNQEYLTGYTEEELLHKNPLDFFKDKVHPKIKKAIKTVFEKGESKLFEDLKIKSGKYIPYYFEAYQLIMNDRYIFMGLAVEESIYKKNKSTFTNIIGENDQIKITLPKPHMKENIILFDDLMNKISDKSKDAAADNKFLVKKNRPAKLKPDHIEFLKKKLNSLPEDFFIRLKEEYPDLTKSEIKFSAYMKMQLSPAEIALILGISEEGIKKKKYRIRKKFNLCRNDSLEFFILKF